MNDLIEALIEAGINEGLNLHVVIRQHNDDPTLRVAELFEGDRWVESGVSDTVDGALRELHENYLS